ncbi:phosphonate ABC transporter, permease protein PhnE [Pseudonocardia kunmingensis]|uniref:Phosphonate transport system permease protein n=1 Tax=Pseudonocardia kunmingensis TaxID=630975 RepID=A0A543D3X1_9PSEU|nr:phosphonate ABC transporter, permease protein PhnE [Pseudonocardia kunmingensis]TQM04033.1 phosphonate transport system permease protein [Pseudonocardia kunmingensis]
MTAPGTLRPPARPRTVTPLRTVGIVAGLAVLVWSFSGTGFSPTEVVTGLPNLFDLIGRMLPPDVTILPDLVEPILETVRMAIVGTALASVVALPLGFLAARNVTPHPALRAVVRPVLNALRTIPELIFALLFVAAVGLGPFAGVMALLLGNLGFLGKIYSETLESVDPRPVDALQGLGATRGQAAWYAVVPQAAPIMGSFVIYLLEINFRAATILGVVGAGGIGYELNAAIRLFQYQNMAMILIAIGVCVAFFDFVSAQLRKRLL